MLIRKAFILGLLGLASILPRALSASESEPPKLTLLEASERALAHYPSLALARAHRQMAAAELGEAEARSRPTATMGASAERYEEEMLVSPIHGFTPDLIPDFDRTLLRGSLTVGYDLYAGGVRKADRESKAALLAASGAEIEQEERSLVATTVTLYLRILEVQELLSAHQGRMQALAAEQDRVERLLEVGRAARVDQLRIAAALAAAEAERATLAAFLDSAERNLARWTGLAPEDTRAAHLVPIRLASDIDPDRPSLEEQALATNPSLLEAKEKLAAAESALRAASGGNRPRVGIAGNYLGFGAARGDPIGEWNVGAALRWSLWDGGQTKERVARAEAVRDAAFETLRLSRKRVLAELDRTLVDRIEAQARSRSLATAAMGFEEVARIEALRLEAGSGVQADFLDAEAVLLRTRSQYTSAQHAVIRTRVELARITGLLDPGWLARSLETKP
ncbi:MAG: TolC family protein [Nitrospirae bacterium]|nr:TolC family protein [Nitrospirota bacterium]